MRAHLFTDERALRILQNLDDHRTVRFEITDTNTDTEFTLGSAIHRFDQVVVDECAHQFTANLRQVARGFGEVFGGGDRTDNDRILLRIIGRSLNDG